jgi:hypothetical protein
MNQNVDVMLGMYRVQGLENERVIGIVTAAGNANDIGLFHFPPPG